MGFFYADPRLMILDHFPSDSTWQLLDPPVSLQEFNSTDWSVLRFNRSYNSLEEKDLNEYFKYLENRLSKP